MSCDLKTFSLYLQDLLQVRAFADVSLNGLQVQGNQVITSIATAVTASLAVIQRAVELQVDLLLVHHGLFLKGKEMALVGTLHDKVKLLLTNNISLVGMHLPLDAHPEFGNNWAVARQLGWTNLMPFGMYGGAAIGVRGEFPRMSRNEFQNILEDVYQHPGHVAFGGKEFVSSCAVVSGGAHKLIREASEIGVDCYVTGSFDEPVWHEAFEEKINFLAFGHAATEKIGVQQLGLHLQQQFHLSHFFIDEPNPF